MEEIIEELRECAQELLIPLELPDMDQIIEAEEEILIGLPYEFKQFQLSVSDLVIGALEPVTIADSGSHTYLPEVAAQAWNDGLPRELIPVCQHGSDYYAIDEEGTVKLWQQGELAEDDWETIWHWARDIWLRS